MQSQRQWRADVQSWRQQLAAFRSSSLMEGRACSMRARASTPWFVLLNDYSVTIASYAAWALRLGAFANAAWAQPVSRRERFRPIQRPSRHLGEEKTSRTDCNEVHAQVPRLVGRT